MARQGQAAAAEGSLSSARLPLCVAEAASPACTGNCRASSLLHCASLPASEAAGFTSSESGDFGVSCKKIMSVPTEKEVLNYKAKLLKTKGNKWTALRTQLGGDRKGRHD